MESAEEEFPFQSSTELFPLVTSSKNADGEVERSANSRVDLKPYFFCSSKVSALRPESVFPAVIKSQMDTRKPKQKKAANVLDQDTPNSLVSALVGEVLAPENLNLVIPITMFTVPPPSAQEKKMMLMDGRLQ